MLENGCIVETGTYNELKNLNGMFTSFIKAYIENQEKAVDSINFFFLILINLSIIIIIY